MQTLNWSFDTEAIITAVTSLVKKRINLTELMLVKDLLTVATCIVSSLASACSGGNPAEWIVTDVITPTQLRLPRHMQLTMGEVLCQ